MTREILEKIDEKFDYENETDGKKIMGKAICGGLLEGVVDGLIINGIVLTSLGVVAIVTSIFKK